MRIREPETNARRPPPSPGGLSWESDERCIVGGISFQLPPVDFFEDGPSSMSMEGADLFLFKRRPLIERYAELLDRLRPRHIVELGIHEGGSTAFLFELARPFRLVAVDRKPPDEPALRDYLAREGLAEVVQVHDDVDQADRRRLGEIVEDAFGDKPLDLVVDDCSHMYEPTRASFNELFPRLRPGGLYVIEDWAWLYSGPPDGLPDVVPLARLIFELLLAIPAVPGLIAEVTVETETVQVWRGEAEVDPRVFEISGRTNPRGQALLEAGW